MCPVSAVPELAGLGSHGAWCLSAAPTSPASGGPPPKTRRRPPAACEKLSVRTHPQANPTLTWEARSGGGLWGGGPQGAAGGCGGPRAFACAFPSFSSPLPSFRLTPSLIKDQAVPAAWRGRRSPRSVRWPVCSAAAGPQRRYGTGEGVPRHHQPRQGPHGSRGFRDEAREDSLAPAQGVGQCDPHPGRENS